MKKTTKKILLFLLFVGLLYVLIRMSGVTSYIDIAYIRMHSSYFLKQIQRHAVFSSLIFVILYALVVAFSIPISPVLNIAGGFFFGTLLGGLYAVAGSTLGALVAFLTVRYVLRDAMQKKFGHALKTFNREFTERGYSYLLFLQLLPITPFAIITIVSSLSPISWFTFAWTTAVGVAPGAFVYAFAGRKILEIEKASDVLSWQVIGVLLILALFSLIPLLFRFKKQQQSLE